MRHLGLLAALAAAWGALACADAPTRPSVPMAPDPAVFTVPALVVSDAAQQPVSSIAGAGASQASSGGDVVYVSLPPGSLPHVSVRVTNLTTGAMTAVVAMVDGGFDPVAVPAAPGDELELAFTAADGQVSVVLERASERRPPLVVRTVPPRGRTDVTLSVRPVVVFTEPVDPSTLAGGVRLLTAEGAVVEATVSLRADEPWVAEMEPAAELESGTAYQLQITQAVRDLSGDALDAVYTASFRTEGSHWLWDRQTHRPVLEYRRLRDDGAESGLVFRLLEDGRFHTAWHWYCPDAGNYVREGSLITFFFNGGKGEATGVVRGDSLVVSFNAAALADGFEDGVWALVWDYYTAPGHIHVANADGSGAVPLTRGSWPAWSPDGSRIAFQREAHVYVINADGSGETRLAAGGHPAWAPDGASIAFSSPHGISVIRLDGSMLGTPVWHRSYLEAYAIWDEGVGKPAWSPDGQHLAFERLGYLNLNGDPVMNYIALLNRHGWDMRVLVTEESRPTVYSTSAAWSPDGSRIAYAGWPSNNYLIRKWGVWTIPANGGEPVAVWTTQGAHADGPSGRPAWSPDGNTIAFTVPGPSVWVAPATGGSARELIPGGYDAVWSPDGGRIAFVSRHPR